MNRFYWVICRYLKNSERKNLEESEISLLEFFLKEDKYLMTISKLNRNIGVNFNLNQWINAIGYFVMNVRKKNLANSEFLEFFFQEKWMLYDFILVFKLNKNLEKRSNLYIITWISQWIEFASGKKIRKFISRKMSASTMRKEINFNL